MITPLNEKFMLFKFPKFKPPKGFMFKLREKFLKDSSVERMSGLFEKTLLRSMLASGFTCGCLWTKPGLKRAPKETELIRSCGKWVVFLVQKSLSNSSP